MSTNRRIAVTALAACLFLAGAGLAADEAAERDQEAIALAWIEAHNAADVEAMESFRDAHFKRSEAPNWRDRYRQMVGDLGRLEIYAVMIDGSGRVKVGVEAEKTGERMRLVFEFHDAEPSQLLQIALDDGGPGGGDFPSVDLSDDWPTRKSEIDAYLRQLTDDGLFSGVVLVAERDGVRFQGAYGLASREFSVPNNLKTRFDVGSCNKDYTRVAIMQLVARGEFSLDDLVGKYLPDFPNREVRDQVTIQHLLDHRSGLGDYFTEEWLQTPMSRLREIDDYIPIWGPKPLLSKPGERESYSNFGYTVLGAIIEKVTDQSYPDYVMEHVFAPAGMSDSGFFETDAVVPNVAVGYTHMSHEGRLEEPVKNIYLEPAKGGPWGKSFSTVHDLYRFYAEMMSGRVLEGKANWLAGGWESGSFALAGGGPGLSAMVYVQNGLMVVAMANMDEPSAEGVAQELSRQLNR